MRHFRFFSLLILAATSLISATPASKKKVDPAKQLIVLDAGHGGFDMGAASNACCEKSLTLTTAFLTKKHLTNMGYKVIMTRSRDVFISLKQRTAIANKTRAKVFVSLHFNAAKNPKAAGIEVFYYKQGNQWRSKRSKKLATKVLSMMISNTGAISRGVKLGKFHVIRESNMPAILIEGGFITNPKERALLKDKKHLEKIAHAIAEGIDQYFNK